jgi:hypothetical protein
MKLVKANSKTMLHLTKEEWLGIGNDNKWIEVDAKKKGKAVNPWAVCTKSVGREDKDKYERCVMDIKKKSPVKKD